MPPKRRGYWVYVGPDATDAPPKKKAATGSSGGKAATKPTTAAAALRRKGKSIAPDWTKRPEWSQDKPTGEWARKCVDRWCLLAPYDTRITEDQWKEYYLERFELDEVNTLKGDKSGPVVSEDLAQNTWEILRRSGEDVAAAILGSKLDDGERKNRIVYTLLGSLYFLSLMGQDEGDILPSPRNIDAQTRLYSPFGIGTSIDFHYSYHYRMRYGEDDRVSSLDAAARAIEHCDAKNPRNCAADPDEEAEPITPVVAFNIFERSDEASATIPESAITGFEEPLLGCKGWLSPMKLADLLLAAGTVMHCHEQDVETPESFPKRLAYFPGENKGKREMNKVVSKIGKLEIGNVAEFIANQDELMKRPICIPQRCLELARQADGASAALTSTANA